MTYSVCLGGEYKKLFVVSNLGGELVYFLFFILFHIIVYMSLLCVVWNQEFTLFTCIFSTHAVMHFVLYFRKYTGWFNWATVYTCNWWIVVRIEFGLWVLFWKRAFHFVNFELLSYVLSRIAKGGVC